LAPIWLPQGNWGPEIFLQDVEFISDEVFTIDFLDKKWNFLPEHIKLDTVFVSSQVFGPETATN
jgi:hypothetical protein